MAAFCSNQKFVNAQNHCYYGKLDGVLRNKRAKLVIFVDVFLANAKVIINVSQGMV